MAIKVYVISDRCLIDFIEDNDVDGFKETLAEDDTIYFSAPETFNTEAEAIAFCAGIGHGKDESAPAAPYPLRTCEPADRPFIEAIETY